ncbi:hypothetical protein C1I97_21835 [Streptomyces sp. NTH33]|uniref:DUF4232 domain-containing protein n=1 Tax=Streptomyces sp. NTH33 TaxID=1735453 RepID=UPI000DA6DC61|nr:DUF4232 domain-containing protein [Streptomyces sp. NTH33]PZH02141.1 hypothetical protein C1I97_21835 [Streptomyces sp. NTH33]
MRRATSLVLPLAAVLLLGGCGVEKAGARGGGSASGCPTGAPSGPSGDTSGRERDGVRITGSGGASCDDIQWEVTNTGSRALTYTVTFSIVSDSGAALNSVEQTVPSVQPGRTVRRTLTRTAMGPYGDGTPPARILRVRSVPAGEAPSTGGPCPESGVRVYADQGDAAMGLRVVGLHLENCGTGPYRLDGYPRLQLLDEDHEPVEGVRILHGGSAIASGTGADAPPRPLTLRPGERARTTLVWRNTVEMGVGDPVNAPYVRTWAKPGAAPVTVVPELDLGTTGKLGVGAWQKDE